VAYGRGGEQPTVTDADLLLGYLSESAVLGGEVVLRRELAERALEEFGAKVGLSALEAAAGVVQVADAEMVRALRVISVERGLDPREFALVAFGGAGPLHACALADELGITRVLVPKACGVLSALGLAISDLRRDYVAPLLAPIDKVEHGELEQAFAGMERRAARDLESPACERLADLRYRGQSFELTVGAGDFGALPERFHAAHERRYGFRMQDEGVDVVNVRVVATVEGARPPLREPRASGSAANGRRRANFDTDWVEVEVLDRTRLGAGSSVVGPAIVEFAEATCLVRPEWAGEVDDVGTLVLERR
jgi:N-methylhydantoinase A